MEEVTCMYCGSRDIWPWLTNATSENWYTCVNCGGCFCRELYTNELWSRETAYSTDEEF